MNMQIRKYAIGANLENVIGDSWTTRLIKSHKETRASPHIHQFRVLYLQLFNNIVEASQSKI